MKFFDSLKSGLKLDRDFTLLLILGALAGVGTGINNSIFANFLTDTYHLDAVQRGFLELPRELPGLLVMGVVGVLAFMGDVRLSGLGLILAAVGFGSMGLLSPTYGVMIIWLMVYSMGTHLFIPLGPSIGMSLSKREDFGKRLAAYTSYTLLGTLAGYGIIWIGFNLLNMTYAVAFLIGAVFYAGGASLLFVMKNTKAASRRAKFVFKRKYSLYYALSMINGARKQIFMTFAPWVLINEFGLSAGTFALLGILVALVSIGTRTVVGLAIDKRGERFVLSLGAVLMVVICFGYVFSDSLFAPAVTLVFMSICYVIDSSMNVVEMARSTYAKKISDNDDEVTSTLAAGTSLDHIFAMTVPIFGGMLWNAVGYQAIFIAAAVIGLINFLLSLRIKIPTEVAVKQ